MGWQELGCSRLVQPQAPAPWGALVEPQAQAMAFWLLATTAAGPLHLGTSPLSFGTGLKKKKKKCTDLGCN